MAVLANVRPIDRNASTNQQAPQPAPQAVAYKAPVASALNAFERSAIQDANRNQSLAASAAPSSESRSSSAPQKVVDYFNFSQEHGKSLALALRFGRGLPKENQEKPGDLYRSTLVA